MLKVWPVNYTHVCVSDDVWVSVSKDSCFVQTWELSDSSPQSSGLEETLKRLDKTSRISNLFIRQNLMYARLVQESFVLYLRSCWNSRSWRFSYVLIFIISFLRGEIYFQSGFVQQRGSSCACIAHPRLLLQLLLPPVPLLHFDNFSFRKNQENEWQNLLKSLVYGTIWLTSLTDLGVCSSDEVARFSSQSMIRMETSSVVFVPQSPRKINNFLWEALEWSDD